MQVPISWIKQYVTVELNPEELAHALTMTGLESDNLGSAVPDIPGIITAQIVTIERHPNADKLTVCQVRTAPGADPITVVCGAPNIAEGNVVPLAQTGTKFPDGNVLKKSKIRGIESNGMMCSQRELGISEDHSGIWILPPETPLGKTLPEALGQDDALIEVEPTPNRGDLLCLLGLAREIAAITNQKSRPPQINLVEEGPAIADLARVDIENYDGCPRYAARLIQGVKIGPSPAWLVERLEACGMRSINNIVDVTNFVMLELGQPLHAFDFNRLRERRIVVKNARAGDKFTTLDGQERALRDDTLLICDGAGPVAIAGVMGGLESEVSDQTVDVLIESAYFSPTVIRRTARLLGLPTEASRRFDKGVDPLGTVIAADRAAALMHELAGGKVCRGVIDAHRGLLERARITLRPERTNQVLGTALAADEQVRTLTRLEGLEATIHGNVIETTAPSYRPDLLAEHDLVEEIARLVGYNVIPTTMPKMKMAPMRRSPRHEFNRRVRDRLSALGFFEAVLTNFEDPERLKALRLPDHDLRLRAVVLQNPLAQNESILRTALAPKLLSCLAQNRNKGASGAVRLFEIGAAFEDLAPELPGQRTIVAGVMSPSLESTLWRSEEAIDGFYQIKGVVEEVLALLRHPGTRIEPDPHPEPFLHPGKCARVVAGSQRVGAFGQLHPQTALDLDLKQDAFVFEIHLDLLYEYAGYAPKGRPVSKFPPSLRDIALVVDEDVSMAEVTRVASKLKSPLLEGLTLFDVFRGGSVPSGKKSLAFHARYQSLERTLTDEDVSREHERLAQELAKKLQAVLR